MKSSYIRHMGMYVNDIDGMVEFYKETFNMSIVSREIEKGRYIENLIGGVEGAELDVCKMKFPAGGMLELIEIIPKNSERVSNEKLFSLGMHHLALTVESVSDIYDLFIEKGIKCLSEPLINPAGTAKVFFAEDPEGNYLELVEEIRI